jgi:hypothetical protein
MTLSLAMAFCCSLLTTARDAQPPERVGEVFIAGNTITQDRVIRRHLQGLQPGQILDRKELKLAEKTLGELGIFKYDPANNVGPTVQVIDSNGPFKDILVKVEEKWTRKWSWDVVPNLAGRPAVRLLVKDANFDLFALPTSLDDIRVSPLLCGPVFEPLRTAEYFAKGNLDTECGTVVWPNGADLAPEALFELPAIEETKAPVSQAAGG